MRHAIVGLLKQGWSHRRIARELGVDRRTVRRCARQEAALQSAPNPTPAPKRPGPRSSCESFAEVIRKKLDKDLSGPRIWRDLKDHHGFTGSYESVKRYIRRLGASTLLPFRRIEVPPGKEAQVDFGRGALVKTAGRGYRRPPVLRVKLSFSRRGYSEASRREGTVEFLTILENAFWHFGGVPAEIVLDNLKAAVARADWYDPDLHPIILAFARHYGCVFLPTKPRTPRHKGKVERDIRYLQDNAVKALRFETLAEQNLHLTQWEAEVADVRMHGTTRRRPLDLFAEAETQALMPLPPARFAFFKEGKRKVHRDGHVDIERSYYSVPPEYVGREVWARWDGRLVRILNTKLEQIALHTKADRGRFSTDQAHIHPHKIATVERGATWLLQRAARIGADAGRWAEHILRTRGAPAMRAIQGLCALTEKHGSGAIDRACARALSYGATRLKDVRALITSTEEQIEFDFMAEHPIIRNPVEYGLVVKASIHDGGAEIVPIARGRRPH
jgi:transposase